MGRQPLYAGPSAAASLAGDPGSYLCQAFTSFTDVFGADAAMLMIPLVAIEHCDPSFVASIQETMQDPDTTQSFRDIVRDLWPQSALADVHSCIAEQQQEQGQQQQTAATAHQGHAAGGGAGVPQTQTQLQELLQMRPEVLLQRGVIDSDDVRHAQEALAVLARLNQKVHQTEHAQRVHAVPPPQQQQQQPQPQPQQTHAPPRHVLEEGTGYDPVDTFERVEVAAASLHRTARPSAT